MKSRLLIGICVYNEGNKLKKVLDNLVKFEIEDNIEYGVIIANDGSTDKTSEICNEYCKKYKWTYIEHKENKGIGYTLKEMIHYGIDNHYDVFTALPGNNKVRVKDIKEFYLPVINENYDYVKGSRYMKGGNCDNLPTFRKIAIPIYSFLISSTMKTKITDITCLVNALKLNIFKKYNINIDQDWLDKYELEYYILYYILKKELKFKETPIQAKYPKSKSNYTKIKPFVGWWSMIRPWVLLKFGIKK